MPPIARGGCLASTEGGGFVILFDREMIDMDEIESKIDSDE